MEKPSRGLGQWFDELPVWQRYLLAIAIIAFCLWATSQGALDLID